MGNVGKENRVLAFLIKKYGVVKAKDSQNMFDNKKTKYVTQGKG